MVTFQLMLQVRDCSIFPMDLCKGFRQVGALSQFVRKGLFKEYSLQDWAELFQTKFADGQPSPRAGYNKK